MKLATNNKSKSWKNRLLDNTKSLGNTGETILDKCSALLNDYCKTDKEVNEIAERAGLCASTIRRIMKLEPTEMGFDADSRGDTMSRILIVFGAEITWNHVTVRQKYLPKEKPKFGVVK